MASMVDSRARVPRVCSSSTALTVLSSDVTLVTITCERRADGGGRGKRTNQSHLLLFFSILPAQSTNERNGYTTRHERVSRSWSTSSWLVGGWLARYARQSETKKKTNKHTTQRKRKTRRRRGRIKRERQKKDTRRRKTASMLMTLERGALQVSRSECSMPPPPPPPPPSPPPPPTRRLSRTTLTTRTTHSAHRLWHSDGIVDEIGRASCRERG